MADRRPDLDDREGVCKYALWLIYEEADGSTEWDVMVERLFERHGLPDPVANQACQDAQANGWITGMKYAFGNKPPVTVQITPEGIRVAQPLAYDS